MLFFDFLCFALILSYAHAPHLYREVPHILFPDLVCSLCCTAFCVLALLLIGAMLLTAKVSSHCNLIFELRVRTHLIGVPTDRIAERKRLCRRYPLLHHRHFDMSGRLLSGV